MRYSRHVFRIMAEFAALGKAGGLSRVLCGDGVCCFFLLSVTVLCQ